MQLAILCSNTFLTFSEILGLKDSVFHLLFLSTSRIRGMDGVC